MREGNWARKSCWDGLWSAISRMSRRGSISMTHLTTPGRTDALRRNRVSCIWCPLSRLGDYIFDKEKRISLLKARNNGVTFSRANQFFPKNVRYQSHKLPFGFYASNRFSSFYPYDCCGIKEKSELLKADYPFQGTPSFLSKRGVGNYFLDLKEVDFTGERAETYYRRYIINNCGLYLPEKYSSVTGNYTKYMTTSYGFLLTQDFT